MHDFEHSPAHSNGQLKTPTATLDPSVDVDSQLDSPSLAEPGEWRGDPPINPDPVRERLLGAMATIEHSWLRVFQEMTLRQKQQLSVAVALGSITLLLALGMIDLVVTGQIDLVAVLGVLVLLLNIGLAVLVARSTIQPYEALIQETEQDLQRKKALTAIAQTRDAKDLPGLLENYLEGIRAELQADRVVVYRFNPNKSGYIAGEAVLPNWVQALNDQIEDACIPQALIDAYRKGRVVPTCRLSPTW